MRICVAHLISFLIIMIPIILNTYFLLKNYREYFELNDSLSRTMRNPPRSNVPANSLRTASLEDRVQRSVAAHSSDIKAAQRQLREAHDNLEIFNSTTGSNLKTLSSSSCNTSENINYADENLGATIQNVRDESLDQNFLSTMVGLGHSTNPPINVLRSHMFPGNCYAFKNCQAELEIRLAKEVYVDVIEMEHISKNRSPTKDISSAPRNFSVFGVDNKTGSEIHLGDFEFTNKNPCELFELSVRQKFRILRFKFLSNHGNPDYTCVYRVAVYGQP